MPRVSRRAVGLSLNGTTSRALSAESLCFAERSWKCRASSRPSKAKRVRHRRWLICMAPALPNPGAGARHFPASRDAPTTPPRTSAGLNEIIFNENNLHDPGVTCVRAQTPGPRLARHDCQEREGVVRERRADPSEVLSRTERDQLATATAHFHWFVTTPASCGDHMTWPASRRRRARRRELLSRLPAGVLPVRAGPAGLDERGAGRVASDAAEPLAALPADELGGCAASRRRLIPVQHGRG
jgi:hypothetical protein